MLLSEFTEKLLNRLALDDSWETDVQSSVGRYVLRLLRDYNFPRSVRTQVFDNLPEGTQSFLLPGDLKRPLQVIWSDTTSLTEPLFSAPLERREGFVRLHPDKVSRYYWLQGDALWTDLVVPAGEPNLQLILAYQSNDVPYNLPWLLAEFEDVLFSLCMYRLAGELGKPELSQTWAPMWLEDQRSLAIYANELEFGNLELTMRAAQPARGERYPA